MRVKDVLLAQLAECRSRPVSVLLSAGIDSLSCLLALQELQCDVTAVSFRLSGVLSTDFKEARHRAKVFGCSFREVVLPDDLDTLKRDLRRMVRDYLLTSKTGLECTWPMLYAIPACPTDTVVSGQGADGHFCISKKGMIHFRDKIEEFRDQLFANADYAQAPTLRRIARESDKTLLMPYLTEEMREEFRGTSWDEVNRPKQKQPIRDTYPREFARVKLFPHVNYQLGDSGIAEHFDRLLTSDWNTRGWKSVRGIYNALVRGEI